MRLSPRLYWLAFAVIVLCGYGLMVFGFWSDVSGNRLHDPDDLMRLQQVRDWLAGQSWFDVTQYRVDPPRGLPMHWSRLLDVPIAAVILLVRPFFGQPIAEHVACIVVPFLTFTALCGLVARITRQLSGSDVLALVAAIWCAADPGGTTLAHPMRIDHHGWQAVCGLFMVSGLLGERSFQRAALAGLAAAMWMHISLEGIIFSAACGAWLGLRWVIEPKREQHVLPAYLGTMALASLALFLVAHGGTLFDRTFCDAVSPVHMTVFAVATLGSLVALRFSDKGRIARIGTLGLTAIACAALYKLWAPECRGGAFSMLTPLDVRLWYDLVAEGRPIWHLPVQEMLGWIGFSIVGLVSLLVVLRSERDNRPILIDYGVLLLAATGIAIFVLRAGALSNLLAIPGALLLLRIISRPIQALPSPLLRVPSQAAAVLLLLPVAPMMISILLTPAAPTEKREAAAFNACTDAAVARKLDALPTGLFMADLDFASTIVLYSHHSVIAASYHRVPFAMDDVLRFFTSDEAQARAVIARRHPAYVYFCPASNSAKGLAHESPNDIASRLIAGRPPAWLKPIAIPGMTEGRLYSVTY